MTATAVRPSTARTSTTRTGTVRSPRPQPRRAARPVPQAAAVAPATAAGVAAVYRRRRLAALAIMLAVVLSVALLTARVGQADAGLDGPPPPPAVYVVQPGDTLWAIADKVAPHTDRREAVGQLEDAAGGTELVPGQRIELPRGLR